jgi:hypothetical protein
LQNFASLLITAPQDGHERDSRSGAPQFLQNSGFPEIGTLHFGHFLEGINDFPQFRQNSDVPEMGVLQWGQVRVDIRAPQFTQNCMVESTSVPHVGHLRYFTVFAYSVTMSVSGSVLFDYNLKGELIMLTNGGISVGS